ncbi:MAG: LysR family transcriptional regulator [Rhodobacteraceae bacterium]|nr:LysR family transcriptional regulator [Paracoccaceae bacterium]
MLRDEIKDLLWFLEVAREANFTRAAARLGTSQSTLSHAIKGLETRLGVRLLNRTTRNVSTTEAGERLFRSLAPRIVDIEAQISDVMEYRDKPTGTVPSCTKIETGPPDRGRPMLTSGKDFSKGTGQAATGPMQKWRSPNGNRR